MRTSHMPIFERVLLALGFGVVGSLLVYIGSDYVLSYWTRRPTHIRRRAAKVLTIGFVLFYAILLMTPLFKTWEFVAGILEIVTVLVTVGISLQTLVRDD